MCVPLLISPCTVKSRSSLLASAHPGDPGKRALKRLWCGGSSLGLLTFSICQRQTHCGNSPLPFVRLSKANYAVLVQNGLSTFLHCAVVTPFDQESMHQETILSCG